MSDLTDYSPRMREMMNDPVIKQRALVELSLDKDGNASEAIFDLMHQQYVGAEKLNRVMVGILQDMIDAEECTDILDKD